MLFMGNTINCSDILCNDTIYEIDWINEKNWSIDFEYSNSIIPYTIKKNNFKIINNGDCFFKLLKKIEINHNIEKICINFLIDFNLLNNNNIKINLIITKDPDDLLKNIINTLNIKEKTLEINNKNFDINNRFNYQLLIDFSYLNFIIFNETIKKNNEIISEKYLSKNYENKSDEVYFGFLIYSNLDSNINMDNYLNLKIL